MTENAMLAARMTELGIGATQLARALDISERTVGYWLSGKITWPNEPTRSKAIKLLRVNNAHEIGFIRPVRRYLGHTNYPTVIAPPDGRGRTGEAATNRRDALRTGGMAVAGAMAGALGGAGVITHQAFSEPDHMAAALDAGSVSAERLAALERATDHLASRVSTSAKFSLLDQTMGTFGTVRRLVRERQRTADQVRLVRTGAKLALVAGDILFDGNQFTLADRWYTTAHRAALDVGDRCLADVALGEGACVPAYSGDPKGVLAMIGPRLESAPAPSTAVAFLWGAKARAHAALGEATEFRRAIGRSRTILDAVPNDDQVPNIFAFHPQRLAFYETTGCVKLGDTTGAVSAGDRALALYRTGPASTTERLMVRLGQASAYAQDGEVDEACRLATAALTDPHAYPAASVLIRAGEFDALLGDDRSAAVRDWRDVLRAARRGGPPGAA